MASLLSPRGVRPDRTGNRRDDSGVRLTATLTRDHDTEETEAILGQPKVGWLVMGLVAVLVVAVSGWVIVAGVTVLGWLTGTSATLSSALLVGTQLWLLSNGAGAELSRLTWTVTPLGISLLFAFMVSRFAAVVIRQYVAEHPGVSRAAAVGRVSAAMGLGYGVLVAGTAIGVGVPAQAARGLLGGLLIAGLGAAWGSSRSAGVRLSAYLPAWARPVPTAVLGAQAVVLASGLVALVASLIVHWGRVIGLADGLDAGVAGGIALVVGQLAYAPNAVLWSASYVLGGGFTVGSGTLVSPAATTLGLLPPIPVLGALPADGGGSYLELLWLVCGVAAGAFAAWLVLRRRPQARFDAMALVGGLAGLVAALVLVALGWLSGGDLGVSRLRDLGPREVPMLVMAASTLGLSGVICGLAISVVRHIRSR